VELFKKLKVNNLGEDVIVLVLRVLEKFRRVRPPPRDDASGVAPRRRSIYCFR
jgi:hypothetical protein